MTKILYTAVCSLVILSFYGCDPAIAVAIQNKSATEKHIQVIYPANFKLPGNSGSGYNFCLLDSIATYNMAEKDGYLHPNFILKLSKDTVARTYSFILKPNYSATVENRFLVAYPTYGQIFIINQTDTIQLIKHGKKFVKKPKLILGGTWTYTIKN